MSRWLEVGPDNYVLTPHGSRLNRGLVVGTERAVVIDTGGGPRQGREILDAVREKTALSVGSWRPGSRKWPPARARRKDRRRPPASRVTNLRG